MHNNEDVITNASPAKQHLNALVSERAQAANDNNKAIACEKLSANTNLSKDYLSIVLKGEDALDFQTYARLKKAFANDEPGFQEAIHTEIQKQKPKENAATYQKAQEQLSQHIIAAQTQADAVEANRIAPKSIKTAKRTHQCQKHAQFMGASALTALDSWEISQTGLAIYAATQHNQTNEALQTAATFGAEQTTQEALKNILAPRQSEKLNSLQEQVIDQAANDNEKEEQAALTAAQNGNKLPLKKLKGRQSGPQTLKLDENIELAA